MDIEIPPFCGFCETSHFGDCGENRKEATNRDLLLQLSRHLNLIESKIDKMEKDLAIPW